MEMVVGSELAGTWPDADPVTEPGGRRGPTRRPARRPTHRAGVAALLRPKAPMAIGVATAATATTPAAD